MSRRATLSVDYIYAYYVFQPSGLLLDCRNPSRYRFDPKRADHFLQADFPILMIPNGVSLLRSRAPVYPMHSEEVGLIEGKESGPLLIRQRTPARSLRSTFLSLFVPRLDGMRVDDCPN